MHTADLVDENVKKIGTLFPNCLTETVDETGNLIKAIDFDMLKQELSKVVVDGPKERYQFTWPEKKKSILLANTPISATLRPCKEESVNFDATENLYIEGDNLDVLKLLQETYLGKVKMIYIDPPYNTGNDFVYEDDFDIDADSFKDMSGDYDDQGNRLVKNSDSNGRFHTDWLNMIYPRLHLAKDLIAKNGIIAISIGYQEVHNLFILCQQLFSDRQVMAITVQTSGGKPNGCFNITNEFIIFIAPNDFIPIPTQEDMKEYSSPYHGMNLATFNQEQRPNQTYPIFIDSKGRIVGCGKSLQERINQGVYKGRPSDFVFDFSEGPAGTAAIWPITNKGTPCVWRLISSRLLNDWNKGYIKVIPQNETISKNKYSIQFLSEGIINKITNSELVTYKISDDETIPTIDVKDFKTAGAGILTVWTDKENYTAKGSDEIKELFVQKYFSYPKPLNIIKYLLKRSTEDNSIILDFFSGSATTAHAVMQLNAEDGGNRKFIMVQIPESCDESSEAFKAGYKNICEIGKERIRRAGRKVKEEAGLNGQNLDIGFRVLKLDSSNMKDVYYTPAEYVEHPELFDRTPDNIKPDRTELDLLFQIMLDLGVLLSSKIEETTIAGKKIYSVMDDYLLACFDTEITDETVTAVARKKPYYAVFRDSSFATDAVAANFEQIFATYSPETIKKVL